MIPFITWLFNPSTIALVAIVACFRQYSTACATVLRTHKRPRFLVGFTLVWLFVWTQPLLVNLIGTWLEAPYPYVPAEVQPRCDAIVLLGGGMGGPKQKGEIPEMFGSADRVWHAARLFHEGKGRFIIASGTAETEASVPLLRDLGVPQDAILIEGQSRNTIENGVYVSKLVSRLGLSKRVLLVTSAWHMRRSEMIFRKAGLDPVPAAVDHEASYGGWKSVWAGDISLWHFLPSLNATAAGCIYVKECQGLLADRVRVRQAKKELQSDER